MEIIVKEKQANNLEFNLDRTQFKEKSKKPNDKMNQDIYILVLINLNNFEIGKNNMTSSR